MDDLILLEDEDLLGNKIVCNHKNNLPVSPMTQAGATLMETLRNISQQKKNIRNVLRQSRSMPSSSIDNKDYGNSTINFRSHLKRRSSMECFELQFGSSLHSRSIENSESILVIDEEDQKILNPVTFDASRSTKRRKVDGHGIRSRTEVESLQGLDSTTPRKSHLMKKSSMMLRSPQSRLCRPKLPTYNTTSSTIFSKKATTSVRDQLTNQLSTPTKIPSFHPLSTGESISPSSTT